MAILQKQYTDTSGMMGVWKISESEEELNNLLNPLDKDELSLVSISRKWKEKASARILLRELLSESKISANKILYDEFGKPYLDSGKIFISISHSGGYAAAIVNSKQAVGIDIEIPTMKILSVAPRVLSENELAEVKGDLIKATVYWCCKEALYKLHGLRNLDFRKNLYIHPFEISREFTCVGEIRLDKVNTSHTLRCMWINNYILAYNL